MNRRFKQVDVFSPTPFDGNPVAVILDAEGLNPTAMQKIAAWTNLSETTFILPPTVPEADYRLRIFAPRNEMRFAGHPTLGSAHAALEAGLVRPRNGRLVQECLAGRVALRVEGAGPSRMLWVTVPTPRCELLAKDSGKALETALGCKSAGAIAIVDVGPRWLILDAGTATIVDGLSPHMTLVSELSRAFGVVGVTVFGRLPDGPAAVRVRSFAPAEGVPEDSVCGSGNASVGAYLRVVGIRSEFGDAFVASQGKALGRDGVVYVRFEGSADIEIGGAAVTCIEGSLRADGRGAPVAL